MKKHPNGDRTLLPGNKEIKRKNTQVPEWTRNAGKIVVVPVELSPAAHGLLSAIARFQRRSSVGEYLLRLAMTDVRALGSALADREDEMLEEFFGIKGKEKA